MDPLIPPPSRPFSFDSNLEFVHSIKKLYNEPEKMINDASNKDNLGPDESYGNYDYPRHWNDWEPPQNIINFSRKIVFVPESVPGGAANPAQVDGGSLEAANPAQVDGGSLEAANPVLQTAQTIGVEGILSSLGSLVEGETLIEKCVVLCLSGIIEKIAKCSTRTQALVCLSTLCEAVGQSFVFARMYLILKEQKNPKVVSECLLWMLSQVEVFGVSSLKLKDLIDFCKDVGLQSGAAATRNASVKLIGVLHKFVGPDIKEFLSDVDHSLLSTLDAEYETNPFEQGGASADSAPMKTVQVTDSTPGADGLEAACKPQVPKVKCDLTDAKDGAEEHEADLSANHDVKQDTDIEDGGEGQKDCCGPFSRELPGMADLPEPIPLLDFACAREVRTSENINTIF